MTVKQTLKKLSRYDPIEIRWRDIVSDSSWLSHKEIRSLDLATVYSIGYYLGHNKRIIRLSDMYDFEDEKGSLTVIPLSCIEDIRILE